MVTLGSYCQWRWEGEGEVTWPLNTFMTACVIVTALAKGIIVICLMARADMQARKGIDSRAVKMLTYAFGLSLFTSGSLFLFLSFGQTLEFLLPWFVAGTALAWTVTAIIYCLPSYWRAMEETLSPAEYGKILREREEAIRERNELLKQKSDESKLLRRREQELVHDLALLKANQMAVEEMQAKLQTMINRGLRQIRGEETPLER